MNNLNNNNNFNVNEPNQNNNNNIISLIQGKNELKDYEMNINSPQEKRQTYYLSNQFSQKEIINSKSAKNPNNNRNENNISEKITPTQSKMLRVFNSNSRQKNTQIKTIYPSSSANNAYESKTLANNLMLNSHYGGGGNNNNNIFSANGNGNESKGRKFLLIFIFFIYLFDLFAFCLFLNLYNCLKILKFSFR